MVELIIKQTDVDPCANQETEDLGASGIFDFSRVCPSFRQLYFIVFFHKLTVVFHFQAVVRIKALQDRFVIEEGVISCFRKHNETLTNEQDQYKEALRTLNKEVAELNEKLKEKTRQWVKEQEAKASLEKELTAFLKQVEMARADAMIEFKAS